MSELAPAPEQKEAKKEQWLGELTGFLAESYQHGWAAGAEKIKDPETGEKTLVYERGEWKYVDKYTGYFAAPGESKIFYKGRHVWSMNYAGRGQNPNYYDKVRETYDFLKEALMHADPNLPLRGPSHYEAADQRWEYYFELEEGDLSNGSWHEYIVHFESNGPELIGDVVFGQEGTCGVIIDKDADYNPVYPWDI